MHKIQLDPKDVRGLSDELLKVIGPVLMDKPTALCYTSLSFILSSLGVAMGLSEDAQIRPFELSIKNSVKNSNKFSEVK